MVMSEHPMLEMIIQVGFGLYRSLPRGNTLVSASAQHSATVCKEAQVAMKIPEQIVTEQQGSERTSGDLVQCPCQSRFTHIRLHRMVSRWVLNEFREAAPLLWAAWCDGLGCSTTLSVKKLLLRFRWNL